MMGGLARMAIAVQPLSEDLLAKAVFGERSREIASARRNLVISGVSPIALLGVWEVLARLGVLDQRFFSAPSYVAAYFWIELSSLRLLADTRDTLMRVAIGFALGATPGLALGVIMGLFPWVHVAMRPFIRVTFPIPHASLLPLVLLIFGIGETSKYVIAALGAFYNILIASSAAVQSIEKAYLDVARNMGANKAVISWSVALPAALPELFSGIRLAWGASLLLIVIVEFVGSSSGLGFRIWRSWQLFSIEPMFVGLIMVGIISFASYVVLSYLQRVAVPWKR
jgi:NitT/TauT family transport system permease protein